jgi:hypothetical protein
MVWENYSNYGMISFPIHPMAPWHPRYVNQVALKASLRPQGYGWIPWGNDGEDDGEDDGEKMGHDYNLIAIYIYAYYQALG